MHTWCRYCVKDFDEVRLLCLRKINDVDLWILIWIIFLFICKASQRVEGIEVDWLFFILHIGVVAEMRSSKVTKGPSSDTKMLRCRLCLFVTNYKSNMTRHLKTHTDARPYLCQICKLTFKRSDHLKLHLQKHVPWLIVFDVFIVWNGLKYSMEKEFMYQCLATRFEDLFNSSYLSIDGNVPSC